MHVQCITLTLGISSVLMPKTMAPINMPQEETSHKPRTTRSGRVLEQDEDNTERPVNRSTARDESLDILARYSKAVWDRFKLNHSGVSTVEVKVALLHTNLPSGLAKAKPASMEISSTSDILDLKLLIQKHTDGALQPGHVFLERGGKTKVLTEITEEKSLMEQGVEEGDLLRVEAKPVDKCRAAVLGRISAPSYPSAPTRDANILPLPSQSFEVTANEALKAIEAEDLAPANTRTVTNKVQGSKTKCIPAPPPTATSDVALNGGNNIKKEKAAAPKPSATNQKSASKADTSSVAACLTYESEQVECIRSQPVSDSAGEGLQERATSKVSKKAAATTAAASMPAGGPQARLRSQEPAADEGKGLASPTKSFAAALAQEATALAATATATSNRDVPTDGKSRNCKTSVPQPVGAAQCPSPSKGKRPIAQSSLEVSAAAAAAAAAQAPGRHKRVASQNEGSDEGPSHGRVKKGRHGASKSEEIMQGAVVQEDKVEEVPQVNAEDEYLVEDSDVRVVEEEVEEEEARSAEDDVLEFDHSAGVKPKRNTWDKECTINLLRGVKRYYLKSSPHFVTDPWVRIRLDHMYLPGNNVTLKDRFLNICKAAQRNFLGCRDKSLISREVQELAYEIFEELNPPADRAVAVAENDE
ncbi:hypothetical protein CEUSTIGMA_g7420.t1 [Chlamydomonas eustigma]|uniref:Ubiquitin-like domain-containing protein n=1 Tax=Chlamydomonas eustigma TaxID=1157962 RepID=A0A250XA62_9CHLO|nr:hypothetical protein CEUSTIGMA_g7420.t1 [Chlamydomonas eustigma]|eukprot:GAX79981.1 hypothetical protein CEUSTIGMA_g7420.t1 [Chlamydomonas eustigma]